MEEPKKRLDPAARWFLGCSIAIVLVGGACVGGIWWLVGALPAMGVEWATAGVESLIEESHIPPQQADAMLAEMDRLRVAADEGRLGLTQFERMGEMEQEIERLVTVALIQWVQGSVLEEVDLPEAERREGQRTMQRLGRAVQEGRVGENEATSHLHLDVERQAGEPWDPEEIRELLRRTERLVDELEIPDEPYDVDVAAEFRILVDGLLEESG